MALNETDELYVWKQFDEIAVCLCQENLAEVFSGLTVLWWAKQSGFMKSLLSCWW